MKIKLEVSYAEKDEAKKLGAKFDGGLKTWYCDDIKKISLFSKWINDANIICENLYLIKSHRKCYRCHKDNEVILLATDRSYAAEDNYKLNTNIQILTFVTWVPKNLYQFLKKYNYYPSYSKTINKDYFMNHCSCKATHGDHFLHDNPKEAVYKHLFYKNEKPCSYAKIDTQMCIPIKATLPYYDKINSNFTLLLHHMFNESEENRASLDVTQKKMNTLFTFSIKKDDIEGLLL